MKTETNPPQVRVVVPAQVRTFQFDPHRASLPPRDYQIELVDAAWSATLHAQAGACHVVSLATGGGKTRVAVDMLFQHLVPMGAHTLWLAPDWELVAQAMDDACARYPEARSIATYIGGAGAEGVLFGAPRTEPALVTFTTLQTFVSRRDADFKDAHFDLIVLDEVHHGEHGKLQRKVHEKYKDRAIFLGTTATKRIGSNYDVVGTAYDLAALVRRGVLARPELLAVETQIDWAPGVDGTSGEFAARSLDELGRNEARNETIVQTYIDHAARLTPAMLFAVNIRHAERLTAMLCAAGVRAAATHCQMPKEAANKAVAQFRSGELDVIVNVRSLTTGVDIPHTRGILLARPTTSDILLTQMIGRGSRKTATKDCFTIVDFVDNVGGPNGVYVKRPDGFFGTPSWPKPHRRPLHEYAPARLETTHQSLLGRMRIQPSQTFEVAFDVQPGVDAVTPMQAANAIRTAVGDHDAHAQVPWTIDMSDDFIRVSSPVLKGADGLVELVGALDAIRPALEAVGYVLADDEPLHVYLGWCPELAWLREAVRYIAFFEPALASLSPPPRYRQPVRLLARRGVVDVAALPSDDADPWFDYVNHAGGSFASFDMRPLFEKGYAVDVPLHGWSLEGKWAATWLSLAMHLLRAAEEMRLLMGDPCRRVQSAPICRGPRGNVDELCTFVGASPSLACALRERRQQMLTESWLRSARFGRLARRVEESWLKAG